MRRRKYFYHPITDGVLRQRQITDLNRKSVAETEVQFEFLALAFTQSNYSVILLSGGFLCTVEYLALCVKNSVNQSRFTRYLANSDRSSKE